MNCYRTSNNKFFTAPPRMADGRHFTDYRPNCHVNNMMRNNNEIYNSFDYRLFLSRNADNIMDANRKHAHLKNAVTKCKQPYETGTMLPEQDRVLCDKHNCKVIENNKNGLGRGRTYSVIPSEPLTGFKNPPFELDDNKCTTPEDNFRYYPNSQVHDEAARNTIPSGGKMLDGGDPSVYS